MGLHGLPFKRNLQLAKELDLDPGLIFRDLEAFLKEVANCFTSSIHAEYTTVCPPLLRFLGSRHRLSANSIDRFPLTIGTRQLVLTRIDIG